MKKILSLVATLALFAPNAFASKARLISLGQDPNGSTYVDDTRSLFLNPAYINTVGDFANFEFGTAASTATTPNSEGGFFHKWDNMHVGLQLGRESDFNTAVASGNLVDGAGTFDFPQNTIELQIGSGTDYKWGAALVYGMTEDRNAGANKKASTYELRGGLMHNSWAAYLGLDVAATSENANGIGGNTKLTQNPALKLGGSYDLDADQKFFLETSFMTYKIASGGDTNERMDAVKLGYAHFMSPDTATRFFYSAAIAYGNNSTSSGTMAGKTTAIPLVVGLETSATDWLKLRGSVTQNVIIDQKVTNVTNTNNPNSTTVAGGVGINWKKIMIDGTLAGTNGGGNSGIPGKVDGNNLLANASMTYMF